MQSEVYHESPNWVISGHMLVQAHVDFSRTFLTTFFLFHTSRLPVLSNGYPCIATIVSFVFWSCSSFFIRLEYLPFFRFGRTCLSYVLWHQALHFGVPFRCIHLIFYF